VKKLEIINILESESWKKTDGVRALDGFDFSDDPDELTIRRAISFFAGPELIKRQPLQPAQKGMATKQGCFILGI
jgi:hypothetical protein